MICQLIGGPADGKELEVAETALYVSIPQLTWNGLRELTYARRESDPTKFDYTPPEPPPNSVPMNSSKQN